MLIGKKIDFNPKLGNLTETNFKGFWKAGNFEKKTGVKAEDAQAKLQKGLETKKK